MTSLYFVFFVVVLTIIRAESISDLVQVQVHNRLVKRSIDNKNTVQSLTVSVTGQNHDYNLVGLKNPSTSVFSTNFKYNIAAGDKTGNVFFTDNTPSQKTLREIEQNIYTEKASDTVLSIKKNSINENNYTIHGMLNNFAIIPTEQNQYHKMISVKFNKNDKNNDYIDLNRSLTYPIIEDRISSRQKYTARLVTAQAQPEIWVIFDYDNSQVFGQDRAKILDYLGVFFHAINNRYATFSDPGISFKIPGVTTVSTRTGQPYIEKNKVPDGSGYDINKVLDEFSIWAYANQGQGPKFDMSAVISGVDLQSLDSNGVYSKSVAGLAYLSAACWKTSTRWYATSVTEDRGGYYDGVFSVAHEFAHNLGAPHDGSGDATSCSWEDGHIMSYKGWGTTNKFYFSSCSINLMRNYISSNQGKCLTSIQASTNIPLSNDNVGDRYSMTALCIKYTQQLSAVPEPTKTGDELCKNLVCRYPTPGKPTGYYSIATLNHPPGDNTPCGNNGKCVNGNCVVQSG